jgi:hypothetical protein
MCDFEPLALGAIDLRHAAKGASASPRSSTAQTTRA